MTAEAAKILTRTVGLTPALCYLIPLVLLAIHGISDKKMEQYMIQNAGK
jgi:hypothetical protein